MPHRETSGRRWSCQLEFVKQTIAWPRYGFKNRARLDRLLMLIELQQNGHADQAAYARIIRDWLLAHSGRPTSRRREVADPLGRPLAASTCRQQGHPATPTEKITPPAAAPRTSDPTIDAILDDLPF